MMEKLLVQVKTYLKMQGFEFIEFNENTKVIKAYDRDEDKEEIRTIYQWVDYLGELKKSATSYELDVLVELVEMDVFIKNNLI